MAQQISRFALNTDVGEVKVRLGFIRLGFIRLGFIRLGFIMLGCVRLC